MLVGHLFKERRNGFVYIIYNTGCKKKGVLGWR